MAERAGGQLRIGVDATNLLHDRRGIGRYVRALLRRWLDGVTVVDVTLLVAHPIPWLFGRRLASLLDVASVQVASRASTRRREFDVVWHPWNGIFFDSGSRDVATIHDVWLFVD